MYIRCADCKASTRVMLGGSPPGSSCHACGQKLELTWIRDLGATPHKRYRRALDYASANRIDLASAYSVLLGIMSLETAREFRGVEPAEPPESAGKPWANDGPSSETKEFSYDGGFHKAVTQGYLTASEANQRGDRVYYASILSRNPPPRA